ncbi:hypothetical protein B0H11DRAFT_1306155 [Mycena galericulata]|nr:hypothetical protein B0H11DRAFT_1306155 [Mycena galericulata]
MVVYYPLELPGASNIGSRECQNFDLSPFVDPQQQQDFSCVFCSYRPNIPPSHTALILDLLKHDASGQYTDFLQTLGITNNTHLRILLGMGKVDRDRFLRDYVPTRITQFAFSQLSQWLDCFSDTHKWTQLSLTPIPRKGEAFEAFLSRPSTCDKQVAQYMRLSREEYEIEATQIQTKIPCYLDIHRGLEQQDPNQVKALVQKICDDLPIFARYQDTWPVYVIIRRILATPGAYGSQSQGSIDASDHIPVHRNQHRCPRLIQYLKHDGPENVAPTAKQLLRFVRMDEELAPALWFLGVKSDAKYKMLINLDAIRKTQFMEETKKMELTPFQRLVLSIMFEA